ncbi:hypothetical protein [Phyllobacterium sp. YR531]|uniref:hypothetical protein n=1 Tax=Phyllobacterium sp. YR531 TaxID=1144343 RepID=UPI00026F9004|nr:hypothetical protein [Phyllobacterium sp. YR531]EJN02163.1 hypothetical protein PMI41_02914 [Phyllobacterium sp. YR531]
MTTGNNDFDPEYVSRCTDAVENIGRRYMVGIIFISMVITSLTMSELQGNQSSSYLNTADPITEVQLPMPAKAVMNPLLHPATAVICKTQTPVEYRNS